MNLNFYLASSVNTPKAPRGGENVPVARKLASELERVTGDRCISRWLYHRAQNKDDMLDLMAVVNFADIAAADYVVGVPLTPTSRGVHFELGASVAMGKPTYLYRPEHLDSLAFDALMMPLPQEWLAAVQGVLNGGKGLG